MLDQEVLPAVVESIAVCSLILTYIALTASLEVHLDNPDDEP
jgi:hypothetical protein